MKLAVAQLVISDQKQQNLQKILAFIARAAASGADIIIFPEFAQGVRRRGAAITPADLAEPLDGAFASALAEAAARCCIHVLCSCYEQNKQGLPFNTLLFYNDAGERIYSYRKTHLYDCAGFTESRLIARGNAAPRVIETKFGKFGFFTCYELRFPEIARSLALQGAEMLLVPTAWMKGPRRVRQLQVLAAARAVENGIFIAVADQCGGAYSGGSIICDPFARILAEAEGNKEMLLSAQADLSQAAFAQSRMPILQQRRPELYSLR